MSSIKDTIKLLNLGKIKKLARSLPNSIKEDFELSDNLVKEINASEKRSKKEFISHEEMREEFR